MNYYDNIDGASIIHRIETPSLKTFDPHQQQEGQLVTQVLDYYTDQLKSSQRALDYLELRGLKDEAIIDDYRLGYADRTIGLAIQQQSSVEESETRGMLQRLGLFKPSGHEFFRGSLVVPFIDESGVTTGGYGRRITTKLKSNSVYHVHWLSRELSFFNVKALINYDHVVLCKSPIEALSLLLTGMPNVVSTIAVRSFNAVHVDILKSHGIKSISIAFGGSNREISAASQTSRIIHQSGIKAHVIDFPSNADINSLYTSMENPKTHLNNLIIK